MRRCVVAAAFAIVATAAVAAAQDTAAVGAVSGSVVDARGAPVPGVDVCVMPLQRCSTTNAYGDFAIDGVRAGRYTLQVSSALLPAPFDEAVDVRPGLASRVAISLPPLGAIAETVTVTAQRSQVAEELKTSVYLASSEDVWKSAGALQDVVRYVQTLPGVAVGTDDFRNDLIVRGGSPLENLYIVDNVEVPNINSYATFASAGGTVSMLDAQAIQDVTFLTGGFPASFGNSASSVLQVTLREGRRDRVAGRATIGFAGAGGVFEGPIGRGGRGAWIVSARRSFLDVFTNDTGIGGVPVLYTLNGKATYDVSPRDRVWLVNVSGYDTVRLGLTENTDPTSELANVDIHYTGWRAATGINWQRTYGSSGAGLFGVTYSYARVGENVADILRGGLADPAASVPDQIAAAPTVFGEHSTERALAVKYDATFYSRVMGKLQAGGSVKHLRADYDTASPYGTDSPYFPVPGMLVFDNQLQATDWQAGAYVQGTRTLDHRYTVTGGARIDRYDRTGATRVSPRGSVAIGLAPRVSLRASAGRYYEQPPLLFLTAFPQNPAVVPFRADHFVAGIAWAPGDGARVTVEAYAKRYTDYPVSTDVGALSLANIGDTFAVRDSLFPLVSAGTGRAQGVEIFVERTGSRARRWYGQANLAFSRSRQAGLDRVLRPSSFDYPVVFNLTGTYRLNPKWDVSLRASALGGRPYTPIDPATSSAQRRTVYDVALVNAARLPAYGRIDLRVDRRFRVGGGTLDVFGGVQNATNRQNVAGYAWDRRNNVLRVNRQLGIFPILGLEWRFGE